MGKRRLPVVLSALVTVALVVAAIVLFVGATSTRSDADDLEEDTQSLADEREEVLEELDALREETAELRTRNSELSVARRTLLNAALDVAHYHYELVEELNRNADALDAVQPGSPLDPAVDGRLPTADERLAAEAAAAAELRGALALLEDSDG